MEKYIVLHTHTIMALLLLLLVTGMYVYLRRLQSNDEGKKWFQLFYLAQIFWQFSDMVRYSIHPDLIGSLGYKISVAGMTIPALAVLMVAYVQFLYRFLHDTFPKERKIVLYIMILISVIVCLCAFWNEFYNNSEVIIFHLIGFSFGLLFNTWAMIVCLRKAAKLKNIQPDAYKGNLYQGINLLNFIVPCIIVLIYGFYSSIGYWSFFLLIWMGNLIQIIIFMNFSVVYINFQDKLLGFNFVMVMTVLMVLAFTLYPPLPPDELVISLTQQGGLLKFILVIIFSMVVIRFIFPETLKKTLTIPLKKLLQGVQKVNAGDLNTVVELSQSDEIGILTDNFNNMTNTLLAAQNKLKLYTENLEQQVVERTSEIVAQNNKIQDQRDSLQKTLDDLKSTQALLIQSEKMASLGELTAGIAHEIQNPLNFVNNFSEVSIELLAEMKTELQNGNTEDVNEIALDIIQNLEKINHHGKRADAIVKGMLQHSRTSTGKKEETDINALCDEYLRLAYHGLRAKDSTFNTTINTDFDTTIGNARIVPQDIGRVILNLLTNAFYVVDEKKKSGLAEYKPIVSIGTKNLEDKIEIKVNDNGNGIPKAIMDKIFQPFFTTKPTGKGTGLGLSLAYDIVKAHDGELKIESKQGEGSCFTILLPYG